MFRMLVPIRSLSRSDELAFEDCQRILDHVRPFRIPAAASEEDGGGTVSKDWALGKKHIFLSESLRQHLERVRSDKRNRSATKIQVKRCQIS
jgi:dachs protein